MNYSKKSALVTLAFALFGAASVLADDSQAFHNRAAQAAPPQQSSNATTVAVYTHHGRAVGNRTATVQEQRADTLNLRSNGHGLQTPEYRAAGAE